MSSPFLAEIRIFPYTFAPRNWAFCQGQKMGIQQSVALFSLIGVTYGGDGRTSFNLPNFQGNVPVGQGQGTGLSPYNIGQTGGTTAVTLTTANMGSHSHPLQAGADAATSGSPSGAYYATGNGSQGGQQFPVDTYLVGAPDTTMRNDAISTAGGGGSHNNLMPYQALNFCIALQGIFPRRP